MSPFSVMSALMTFGPMLSKVTGGTGIGVFFKTQFMPLFMRKAMEDFNKQGANYSQEQIDQIVNATIKQGILEIADSYERWQKINNLFKAAGIIDSFINFSNYKSGIDPLVDQPVTGEAVDPTFEGDLIGDWNQWMDKDLLSEITPGLAVDWQQEGAAGAGFDFTPWTTRGGELGYDYQPPSFDFTPFIQQLGPALTIPNTGNNMNYEVTTPQAAEQQMGQAIQVNPEGINGGVQQTGAEDVFDIFDFDTYDNFFEGGFKGVLGSISEGWDSFYSKIEPFVDMGTDAMKVYSLYNTFDRMLNPEKVWQEQAARMNYMYDNVFPGTNPYERLANGGVGGIGSMLGAEAPNKMAQMEQQKLSALLKKLDIENRKLMAEAVKSELVNKNTELRSLLGSLVETLAENLGGQNGAGMTKNLKDALNNALQGFLSPDPDVNYISFMVRKCYIALGIEPDIEGSRQRYQEGLSSGRIKQ